MNKIHQFFALCILSLLPQPLLATTNPLIADLSAYLVPIDSGFTGTRLMLFGARNEGGDVVVVLRGENKSYTVRKKKRVGGIWVNRDAVTFKAVPMLYALGSSRPLADIHPPEILNTLAIGENSLLKYIPAKTNGKIDEKEYAQAFLKHQAGKRLYHDGIKMQFMGETLFKANIDLPDTVSEGDYVAEAYLLSGGELVGMQSIPLRIEKSGVDAKIYAFAHGSPAMYGLFAISLALLAGWAASRLFEKI